MSSVTVYGRHSPDFFFSDAYSVFVCKVHYLLALFLRIAYRGISSSAFVLDTAYHKVCSVDHAPIADLDSRLWVSLGRSSPPPPSFFIKKKKKKKKKKKENSIYRNITEKTTFMEKTKK